MCLFCCEASSFSFHASVCTQRIPDASTSRLPKQPKSIFELCTMKSSRPYASPCRDNRLVVVPLDLLHNLPFHALFDGNHYLVDTFTISYAPSASIYTICH